MLVKCVATSDQKTTFTPSKPKFVRQFYYTQNTTLELCLTHIWILFALSKCAIWKQLFVWISLLLPNFLFRTIKLFLFRPYSHEIPLHFHYANSHTYTYKYYLNTFISNTTHLCIKLCRSVYFHEQFRLLLICLSITFSMFPVYTYTNTYKYYVFCPLTHHTYTDTQPEIPVSKNNITNREFSVVFSGFVYFIRLRVTTRIG